MSNVHWCLSCDAYDPWECDPACRHYMTSESWEYQKRQKRLARRGIRLLHTPGRLGIAWHRFKRRLGISQGLALWEARPWDGELPIEMLLRKSRAL